MDILKKKQTIFLLVLLFYWPLYSIFSGQYFIQVFQLSVKNKKDFSFV